MRHDESNIQIACVRWFRLQYPSLAPLLFSVPNGGRRDRVTGAILKAEGAVAGVADLLLLQPTLHYHGLCIEMKTPKGKQSPEQKAWQSAVEAQGYKYVVVHSLEEFVGEIESYLAFLKAGFNGLVAAYKEAKMAYLETKSPEDYQRAEEQYNLLRNYALTNMGIKIIEERI